MEKLPARAGWLWIKEGFALFRKQPAAMSTLFLAYMFLMLAVGIVPILGQILPLALVPVFSIGFMQACVDIERDKRIFPNLLLTGFRSPAFPTLLKIGALYPLAAVLAVGASSLIDGGVFWKVMAGQIAMNEENVQGSGMGLAMLFAAALYTPAAMAFWYAAPLAAWQNMGVGKALFYSFFAVRRSGKAFLVYGVAWMVIGVLFPAIFSSLAGLLSGQPKIAVLILLPLTIVMTVIMYCSFYPSYTHVFGRPGQPDRLGQPEPAESAEPPEPPEKPAA